VAMGVILITVIYGYKLAVLMNLIFALLVALITGGEFVYLLPALIGGLVAIYAVSRVSQRSDLAKAGLYVAASNTAVIISLFLFMGNLSLEYGFLRDLGYALVAGIANGLLSSIIAIGMLPYLESAFGVTTAITLLELSNPNHPLLRQLLSRAPGTYYHSMMVCNLAEAAAEAVGADALLTRAGAYYHDIGKLKRPYFFTENQLSGRNPHEKISPNLSALIIGAHVKDGVELARKHRLPSVITDIIRQHHGSSLISFFYQQALEANGQENVSIDKFRYEGPLPQTKEAAIIMLADAVEAGIRSLSKPAGSRVETLIRRIIKEKLNDNQMDESDLTLKELDQIGDAFVNIMAGIYHTRIEYPEKDLKAEFERSAVK
jgi:cyclic-di-AMP phosphodiesterase PgpH